MRNDITISFHAAEAARVSVAIFFRQRHDGAETAGRGAGDRTAIHSLGRNIGRRCRCPGRIVPVPDNGRIRFRNGEDSRPSVSGLGCPPIRECRRCPACLCGREPDRIPPRVPWSPCACVTVVLSCPGVRAQDPSLQAPSPSRRCVWMQCGRCSSCSPPLHVEVRLLHKNARRSVTPWM
jgi:hypothetical protein